MSIIVGLKFLHYLGLFLAGGLGVANGLLAKAHQMAGEPPAPPVQETMMNLARLGACCNPSSMGYRHWFKLSNLQRVRGRLVLPHKVAWRNNSVRFNIIFEFSSYLNQQSWCTAQPIGHENHSNDIAWSFSSSSAGHRH